ncbi:unnamed protein product, partial [Brachionus calyciflorus]
PKKKGSSYANIINWVSEIWGKLDENLIMHRVLDKLMHKKIRINEYLDNDNDSDSNDLFEEMNELENESNEISE